MSIWIGDAEADGFLEEATKIHCICLKEFGVDNWIEIEKGTGWVDVLLEKGCDTLVFHNGIGYDFPLFKKLHGIDYSFLPDTLDGKKIQHVDTLVLSRELNPDRLLPTGMPERVANPVTGKKEIIGPHGLIAWSYRVNGTKPVIHDWINQPIEVYVNRCREDVLTTEKVLIELLNEAGITL